MKRFFFLAIVTCFLVGCESNPVFKGEEVLLDEESLVEQMLSQDHVLVEQSADIDLEQGVVFLFGERFDVEIADDSQKRRKGLMNRDFLDKDAGMLFVFGGENIYPFWMKDTLIPLTIIWMDRDGVVVDAQDAYPCQKDPCPTYVPRAKATYVLEVNQGIFVSENLPEQNLQ